MCRREAGSTKRQQVNINYSMCKTFHRCTIAIEARNERQYMVYKTWYTWNLFTGGGIGQLWELESRLTL